MLCVVIIMLCVVSAVDHFYLSVSIIGPAPSTESSLDQTMPAAGGERRRKSVIFIFIQQSPLLEPRCGCEGGRSGFIN